MSRATQSGVVTVRRRVDDEARAVKPPYEFSQREGGLEPREGGAEAVVDAAAEAEMLIVGALGVEPVGVPEAGRVAVHALRLRRWSPRAFAERPVAPAQLRSVLEAAR